MSEKKDTRNDIQKEINQAFALISAVLVSGDAADAVAGARAHLRKAYELAADKPAEKEVDHG